MLWDTGTWEPVGDPHKGLEKGELKFRLAGERLHGGWVLVHTRGAGGDEENQWLLIKERDEEARPGEPDPWGADDRSVATGRTMEEIAAGKAPRERRARAKGGGAKRRAGRREATARGRVARPRPPSPSRLATLVEEPPEGDGWLHEIKYDGYRIAARVDRTRRAPALAQRAGLDGAVLRGRRGARGARQPTAPGWTARSVVFDARGVSDFGAPAARAQGGAAGGPHLHRLRPALRGRRGPARAAAARSASAGWSSCSGAAARPCTAWCASATTSRAAAATSSRRPACRASRAWSPSAPATRTPAGARAPGSRAKCGRRQEFVVGGFTEPSGARRGFGALLLGVVRRGGRAALRRARRQRVRRRHAGAPARAPEEARAPHARRSPTRPGARRPAACTGRRRSSSPRWPSPSGPATASCATRSSRACARTRRRRTWCASVEPAPAAADAPGARPPGDGGARDDSGAAAAPPRGAPPAGAADKPVVGGVAISHPDRVVFPDPGLTKLDVARYYEAVADLMVPYLERRAPHRHPLPRRDRRRSASSRST